MHDEFECRVVASLLDSGAVVANAAQAAFLLSATGLALTAPTASSAAFALAILCWAAGGWASIRVTIDASLFRELAARPDFAMLDGSLERLGFPRRKKNCTPDDRFRASLRLWRFQLATFVLQLISLAAGAALMRVSC